MEITAPMMANVWKIVTEKGTSVSEGDTLMILESMKMEVPIDSTVAGTIADIMVAEGDVVNEGNVLVVVDGA